MRAFKRKPTLIITTLLCALWILVLGVPAAFAEEAAPGFQVIGRASPTNLPPGGEGVLKLYAVNVGAGINSSEPATLTDTLPPGLQGHHAEVIEEAGVEKAKCSGEIVITCPLSPAASFPWGPTKAFFVVIPVTVAGDVSGTAMDHVTVSGGSTHETVNSSFSVSYGSGEPSAGFANLAVWLSNANGTLDTQAGSHPYELTTAFALNDTVHGKGFSFVDGVREEAAAGGEARDLNVNLPPGIVGDPTSVPQCSRIDFERGAESRPECPLDTQVGVNAATVAGNDFIASEPIYNLVPPPGVAAEFGFDEGGILVYLDSGIRSGGDNGITTHVDDLPQREITFDLTTIWGVPAEASHDPQRHGITSTGEECEPQTGKTGCPAGVSPKPLLTLPTSCSGSQPEFSMELLGTWTDENYVGQPINAPMLDSDGEPTKFTGCERLRPFDPSINITPDTTYTDTPAGLSVDVKMPQGLNPEGLQTPGLEDTTVVLPEGIAVNPGQATGLQACQPAQEALGSLPDGEINEGPPSCPSTSKVGVDELSTPLLPEKLQGNVYILDSNPPNLQLLVTASGEGVNLKLVGNVHLDENTGQLVTTFEKTPDVPFTDFKLSFSGGAQAALATPTKCGVYGSSVVFTPWSSPFIEEAFETSRFQITAGPNGSSCVWPMPFDPTMTAGSTTDQAGGYTDFTMLLTRGDEQQRIKTLSFRTPEGLLGMISKVSLCPEPQAAQGTCSSASQIGHTVVGAGPGPYPFYIPQAGAPKAPIYLTGPYDGAPFGLSIVVPLIAGPFNLGTEVVRGRIEVDPHTSQITITTNPLPLTEKGIPDDLRLIDAVIDRPEFMFNPTSCAPMSFSGTATSFEGATAPLASHFQVGSCQALKFAPNFKVSTSGKTSRANGASLTAKIVYPVGNLGDNQASSQSNIHSVKVDLPKQLPSRLTTLQKACPAKVFDANPASCPADSIIGHGKAITPLLPVPVEGPAYFVSHAGEEFPNLIVVLQGDNVTVDLIGDTFIDNKTSITSSTFKEVPDVPIASFELNLPQGKYSALAANGNLCKSRLAMPTAFTGQNGAVLHQNTPISVTGCAKVVPKQAKKHKKSGKAHKAKKK
jgi:hypothetical protein